MSDTYHEDIYIDRLKEKINQLKAEKRALSDVKNGSDKVIETMKTLDSMIFTFNERLESLTKSRDQKKKVVSKSVSDDLSGLDVLPDKNIDSILEKYGK